MIFCALIFAFLWSVLNCKLLNMQKVYPLLISIRTFQIVKNDTNEKCKICKKTNKFMVSFFFFLDTLYWWSYSKCWYENWCLDSGYNTRGIQGQHSAYNSTSPGHHHGQWSRAGHEGGKSGRVQLTISAVKGFTLSLL